MAGTICTSAESYLAAMSELLGRVDPAAIDRFSQLIVEAWETGHRVFVFGNGGSASTASHYVADLTKTAAVDGKRRLQAIGLSDNMGLLTALGNDISYDQTFAYALETYACEGDIAVAISCSGNSPNVLQACRWAADHGVKVVALTGFDGGKAGRLADLHLNIPSDNYGLIEDLHLAIGHMAAQCLKAHVGRCG